MFAAMTKSSLGDDVFNEDDSIKNLERYVATLCGHEAAIYCTSGTMVKKKKGFMVDFILIRFILTKKN